MSDENGQAESGGVIQGFLGSLKDSGESAFQELSNQLLENELFMSAMKKSLEAKGQVDRCVGGTLDFFSLPSKNDFLELKEEIEQLRGRLVKQQRLLKGLESSMQELLARVGAEGS